MYLHDERLLMSSSFLNIFTNGAPTQNSATNQLLSQTSISASQLLGENRVTWFGLDMPQGHFNLLIRQPRMRRSRMGTLVTIEL